MISTKQRVLATSALVGGLLLSGQAFAQSTGSQSIEEATAVDEIVVTGVRGPSTIGGVVTNETAPKARTSITQEYLTTQQAGQTIFQSLNQTPGLNFTNADPYGSSGGNVRLRGQDGNRVALLWDGIPLNDTGNYATFTNQLLDPELVEQVNVNTGTTDVDAPTAAGVGGTINYTTLRPTPEFSAYIQPSVGSWDYNRVLARVDSGEFGPFGTSAFIAGSYQRYDKFRGPGDLEKTQGNAYVFQNLRGSDFVAVGFHYNENRNNFYRNITLAQFADSGGGLDNDQRCARVIPVAGVANNEGTQNNIITSQGQLITNTSCTNFHEARNNPSNTGNVRAQSRFDIGENLRITFDPYFQYVLANGGGFTLLSETDGRLRGASTAGGNDLNGDGDILDTVSVYTPSNTNTRRYGFTSSLIYDLNDNHQLRAAYTIDYGRHRQTGEAGFFDSNLNPEDVFGGKDGYGRRVRGADNSHYRTRDRFSIASLQQLAAQYRGSFMDERIVLDIGVRAPFFKRELNNYCYTVDAISSATNPAINALVGGFTPRCTTEVPIVQANGAIRFAATGTADFVPQYATEVEYDAVLPNIGASYEFLENHRVFASFAQGFAAPRTDNLYSAALINGRAVVPDTEPEESDNYDFGYRYNGSQVKIYGTVFQNNFSNRIVQSFDQDLGFSVDRNVGTVVFTGFDFQIGFDPIEELTLSTFVSILEAELQDNTPGGTLTGAPVLTAGKKLVEIPELSFGGRVELRPIEGLDLGLQAKFVDSRFTNDLNTEETPSYAVWDFDARYGLSFLGYDDAFVQFNVTNIFNEEYLGSISSQSGAGLATASVGAPQTFQLSIRAGF